MNRTLPPSITHTIITESWLDNVIAYMHFRRTGCFTNAWSIRKYYLEAVFNITSYGIWKTII